jgi:RNA 3'-terminal phosphate cyclase-like protein
MVLSTTTTTNSSSGTLRFDDGTVQFRQRLALSLLVCRPLLLKNIRPDDIESPGLRNYEVSYLRLIDAMTNGSRIEINNTGTQLRFVPGVLTGGEITHHCPTAGEADHADNNADTILTAASRSIGWFLEGILPLAPFGKESLHLHLTGITDGAAHMDPSVDYLQSSVLPLMTLFGIGVDGFDADVFSPQPPKIRVERRGAAPLGGGSVEFYCPRVKELKSIDYTDVGKFQRVRGTCVSCKVVSSSLAARVAYSAKGFLMKLIPDVWIHTDVHTLKQHQCGPSPGLSCVLWATSTTGVVMTAEACRTRAQQLPEDLGVEAAVLLLDEVRKGGCVDTGMQSLALLWMLLTPEDVSRIRLGTLSQYTIESLRLFQQVLGTEFKIKADQESKTVVMSCLGTGYRNMAKASS